MTYLKFKICRKIGENIWHNKKLTVKQNIFLKQVRSRTANRKQSDFSKKLQQIKKLAYFYGMRSLNNRATSNLSYNSIDKKKNLLLALETRLDVILVRLGFCSTLFYARQLIAHKKVCVNFHIVNIPSFAVQAGDIVSTKPSALGTLKMQMTQKLVGCLQYAGSGASHSYTESAPQNLEVCYKTLNAVLLYEPSQIRFPYKIDLDFLFSI